MSTAPSRATAPVTVLVVDDDYRVAKIHAAYVDRIPGFTVAGQAHSAAQALHLVAAIRPDLVLMDVYLPDGDGLTVIRKLLEAPESAASGPHPDFMVITAARDVSTVRTAMQLGAVHYLVKPFGYPAMAEKLTSYLDLRRRMQTLNTADADQADVDELFGLLRGQPALPTLPAKGHSAPTLELVRSAVRAAPGDISASEVAERVGISRPTAQRYLSYLTRHGVVRLQLRYGTTGRPEHRYSAVG
ncbi:response regulator receiver and unknown domain protein [Catenulispora acidiphila DSM 44928]|uniref:Transcriptional regulatory protein n=1 Tax=Catenulispora acidiphila (strain DSM 44928 / JCM 14897 / NBRC 102108 / NRRL B-24433 / ID139908) TaxID=479433 RepID=C7QAY5_CATAD|nr:response regulator [Catenulispora acidiphila]ACU74458.1 response regulator receiver and unknown domain protein [Catenulispora acidiphila DSM 44928]